MNIGQFLIVMILAMVAIRYFFINLKRFNKCNIFPRSRIMDLLLSLLLIYGLIITIQGYLIKDDIGIPEYAQVLIAIVAIWRYITTRHRNMDISVENIYKGELEDRLEAVFRKRNLELIKEESDEETSTFSFSDPYINSSIAVHTKFYSTRKHDLVVENQQNLPSFEEILKELDATIPPTSRDTVVIRFFFKTVFFGYICWKIYAIFIS